MSSQEFYVSHEGQQMGPYPLDTILKMVKNGELNILDYLYDQGKEDWVLLMEYPALEKTLKDHKPASAPQSTNSPSLRQTVHDDSKTDPVIDSSVDLSATKPAHLLVEWYILKGENKFGPFSYADVIKMLQNKVAFEFDFVWHSGLANWVRIADHDAFQPEQISQMKNASMPDISEVFFRRRHRRVRFGGTILVHDNKSVWKGTGVEISAGGAGVVMENAMVVPGQTLYLHFKPGDGVPPFNATCEVVSKQYVEGVKDKKTPIRYGLKFTTISSSAQNVLQEYSKAHEVA